MPMVDGEHFPYTAAGYKAAAEEKKKLKKKGGKMPMDLAMRGIKPPPARK